LTSRDDERPPLSQLPSAPEQEVAAYFSSPHSLTPSFEGLRFSSTREEIPFFHQSRENDCRDKWCVVVVVKPEEYNVSRCTQEGEMGSRRVLTLRLDSRLRAGLDKLAEATRRSRSFLAAEAIRDYVTLNRWQIEEIEKGLAEAGRGEFASEREVNRVVKKWARRAR